MANRYDDIISQMDNVEFDNTPSPSSPDNQQPSNDSTPGNDQPPEESNDQTAVVKSNDQNDNPPSPDQTQTNIQSNQQNPSNQEEGTKQKNNRPKYSHEEQVQYSFSKLNSKLSQTKRELKEALAQIEELKKANTPKQEKLGPEAFGSNEDYLKYIANQSIIEQLQKAAEAKRLSDAEAQASRETQDRYTKRATELFKSKEDIDAYNHIVGKALEEGLADVLESDKVISDFIKSSDWAPRMVFHFAAMPEDLDKIASIKDPTDKRFALNMLQQRIMTIFSRPATQTNPNNNNSTQTQSNESNPPQVPIVGKAGTGAAGGTGSNPEISMDEAMARIRRGY